MAFPGWVLIPDASTLEKYIKHEKEDYERRQSLSNLATAPTPQLLRRTLPTIDRTTIRYHPAIISPQLSLNRFDFRQWPKVWLGEPTTVIHRVARRGLLESNPVRPIFSGGGRWKIGVPATFQLLIGELIRLWARPTPMKKTSSHHEDSQGKH